MKNYLFVILLLWGIAACDKKPATGDNGPEYCTVKGTIKGVKEGKQLELEDAWNHFEVIETAVVKDGTFEFHPHITEPTHVYLYTKDGKQLKDFILEPGTIIANVDAEDKEDYEIWASGTVSNDTGRKYSELLKSGDKHAADSLMDEALGAEQTGPLALLFAENDCNVSAKALRALDHLSPELAKKPFVADMRKELTRRMKTEPKVEGSDFVPVFIDMEYPDMDGNPVSLSSIVHHPDNRYVLVDFWATWCDPCVASVKLLKELYSKYHSKGLEIYSVSQDVDKKQWKSFLTKNEMNWKNVLDNQAGRKTSKAWHDYALRGIPTYVLIECETGEIIARNNVEELDALLADLLH